MVVELKPFKEIIQPTDKTKKTVRLMVPVTVPANLHPSKVMDAFYDLCKEKGWDCMGGGVQFPDNDESIIESK